MEQEGQQAVPHLRQETEKFAPRNRSHKDWKLLCFRWSKEMKSNLPFIIVCNQIYNPNLY